jgi:hypothetical protein
MYADNVMPFSRAPRRKAAAVHGRADVVDLMRSVAIGAP